MPRRNGKKRSELRTRRRFFFSSRRRHTRLVSDWSSDVCSSDLKAPPGYSKNRVAAYPRLADDSSVKSKRSHAMNTADYARVERAILYLDKNHQEQPSLEDAARSVGLSEHHFQRLFRRWAGISPKRFVQFLTLEHAKELLRESRPVLDAAFEAGLSSPGRLHDLFVQCEAVTPGEFQRQGAGLTITYGFFHTPFGECLLGATERGICGLLFVAGGGRKSALADLRSRWAGARLVEDSQALGAVASQIFEPPANGSRRPLTLLL